MAAAPASDDDAARLRAANDELAARLAAALAADADRLAPLRDELDALRAELADASQEREWLRSLVGERDADLARDKQALQEQSAQRDADITSLQGRLTELESAFGQERTWLKEQIAAAELLARDRVVEIEALRARLLELDAAQSAHAAELAARDAALAERDAELQQHRSDLGYRVRSKLGRGSSGS